MRDSKKQKPRKKNHSRHTHTHTARSGIVPISVMQKCNKDIILVLLHSVALSLHFALHACLFVRPFSLSTRSEHIHTHTHNVRWFMDLCRFVTAILQIKFFTICYSCISFWREILVARERTRVHRVLLYIIYVCVGYTVFTVHLALYLCTLSSYSILHHLHLFDWVAWFECKHVLIKFIFIVHLL